MGNEKGFTLVEMLVAIGVAGCIFAAAMQLVSSNVKMQKSRLALADFQQDTDWAMEQISADLRNCSKVWPTDADDSAAITFLNQAGNEATAYTLEKEMLVRRCGSRAVALTDPAKVKAEKLVFVCKRLEDSVDGMTEDKYPGNKRVAVRYVIDVAADFSSAADPKLKRTVKVSVCTINKWNEWLD